MWTINNIINTIICGFDCVVDTSIGIWGGTAHYTRVGGTGGGLEGAWEGVWDADMDCILIGTTAVVMGGAICGAMYTVDGCDSVDFTCN